MKRHSHFIAGLKWRIVYKLFPSKGEPCHPIKINSTPKFRKSSKSKMFLGFVSYSKARKIQFIIQFSINGIDTELGKL
jgi:hypothetical protein